MLDNSVTIKAETVEKATKIGLSKLNLRLDEVDVTVISEGKKGLFGFGKQDAIVEISAKAKYSLHELEDEVEFTEVKQSTEETVVTTDSSMVQASEVLETTEVIEQEEKQEETVEMIEESSVESVEEGTTQIPLEEVAEYLQNVIHAFGADAKVSVESSSREVHFNIETDKSGLIIGKHGKIIDALQSLAQVMVHRGNRRRVSVLLNVGDYRDRRANILESIAERTAKQVLRTKQSVILDSLPAFERKQIHSYLSKVEHVRTHSEGVEPNRYLVVEYEN